MQFNEIQIGASWPLFLSTLYNIKALHDQLKPKRPFYHSIRMFYVRCMHPLIILNCRLANSERDFVCATESNLTTTIEIVVMFTLKYNDPPYLNIFSIRASLEPRNQPEIGSISPFGQIYNIEWVGN